MKTNKLLVACIMVILLATTNSSYARHRVAPNYEAVISDYIDSYINSNFKKLAHILSDEACVKIPREEKVVVQNKESLIEKMKADNGTKQNCTCKYEVIGKSGSMVVARVDFQYDSFKQQNFLILEKNEDKEWKITQVCKIYQNTNQNGTSTDAIAGK